MPDLPRSPRPRLRATLAALAAAAGLLAASPAPALQGRLVIDGLVEPVAVTAPRGDRRLFIVEKAGRVLTLDARGTLATYLDITDRVATDGERGLLGLAFDPQFARNGRLYVNYIDRTTLATTVVRYTAASAAAGSVDPATAEVVITVPQPAGLNNHKAGWMAFRPGDARNLYIALGDGGGAYDTQNNAQDGTVLLGKLLRVDVSGSGPGYGIPADNPFADSATVRPEIWALGLRNPWRNSFDRATGDLWIADVGQDTREELNFEPAVGGGGRNYGWRLREGTVRTPLVGGNAAGLTGPVFDYPHSGPTSLGRSIIGGHVYRGPAIPDASGRYFFGDFVANRIYSLAVAADGTTSDLRDDTAALLGPTGLFGVTSFGEDARGGLYLLGIDGKLVAVCGDTPAPRGPCAAPPAGAATASP